MFICGCKDAKCLCDQLECNAKETAKGIQVEITAKDASKTESLKALIKAVHDFCGCNQFQVMPEAGPASSIAKIKFRGDGNEEYYR